MSLPPQVIHVKRKRTEEGPVPSFLKIESAIKRHRSDAFLYRRHDPEAAALLAAKRAAAEAEASGSLLGPRSARPPRIHASQPGDEKRKKNTPPTPTKPKLTTTTAPNTELEPSPAVPSPRPIAEPRRFHLSRHSLMAAHAAAGLEAGSIPLPGIGVAAGLAGVRKRARYAAGGQNPTEPAVFVERSKRKHRARIHKKGESGSGSGSGSVSGIGKTVVDDKVMLPAAASDSPAPGATLAPLPKRPGRRLATKASNLSTFTSDGNADVTDPSSGEASAETDASTTTTSAPALPPSVSRRQWNTDMEQLTRDMNDYTLEIIGRNLAQMEVTARTSDAQRESDRKRGEMSRQANERRKAAYAKYKPKPGMRYSERQATGQEEDDEAMGEEKQDGGEEDDDMGSGSETDEDDYVTETYVRIPGHEAAKAQAQAASEGGDGLVPATIGLLVFDNEPDLEFFYGVEEDSEEEFEDDEDENAENYYTHDYPEDEVSSDDEFDRDAYHYRNGNASDLEEFEENSDGEGQGDGSFGIGVPLSARLTKPGDL